MQNVAIVADVTRPHAEPPAAERSGAARHFYFGYGLLLLAIAITGFAPSVRDYFTGAWYFPPVVHLHGALMLAWLVLYSTQARLAERGSVDRHRRLGVAALFLAPLVWISMIVATIAAFRRFEPDGEFGFLTSVLLIQAGIAVLFPVFVTWGLSARRNSGWHRRMMTFASLVLVQAAVDRMNWLPDEGLPMFWHNGIRLYALMLPLFLFDLVTIRRIHWATLAGTAIIVAMHATVSLYWNDGAWASLARSFWLWVR